MGKRVLLAALDAAGGFAAEEVGIATVAATLIEHGHEVRFLYVDSGSITNLPDVIEFEPQVFGLAIYNVTRGPSLELIRTIRSHFPDIMICAGGYLPTYYPEELLREAPEIDVVVRGEGELTMVELAAGPTDFAAIQGLSYRAGDRIASTPDAPLIADLGALPFPVVESLMTDIDPHVVYACSSRGCNHRCSFCLSPDFNRLSWRGMEPEQLVDGIQMVYDRFEKRIFGFTDNSYEDSGGGKRYARIHAIADELIRRGLKIQYFINLRARFGRYASDELMQTLLKSGLTVVYVGIESGSDEDLVRYGKRTTDADNRQSIEFFRKYGLSPSIGFISFNPYSTFESLRANLAFLHDYGYGSQLSFTHRMLLYRGTEMMRMAAEEGLLIKSDSYEVHDYRFTDERIGVLSHFLEAQITPIRLRHGLGTALPYLFEVLKSTLSYYRREFPPENRDVWRAAELVETRIDALRNRLNVSNTALFSALVDLSERGWKEPEALRLLDGHFDMSILSQDVSRIRQLKSDLDVTLVDAGLHPNALS